MEIIIKGTTGEDFPNLKPLDEAEKKKFYQELEMSVRRRLELTVNDTVKFDIKEW